MPDLNALSCVLSQTSSRMKNQWIKEFPLDMLWCSWTTFCLSLQFHQPAAEDVSEIGAGRSSSFDSLEYIHTHSLCRWCAGRHLIVSIAGFRSLEYISFSERTCFGHLCDDLEYNGAWDGDPLMRLAFYHVHIFRIKGWLFAYGCAVIGSVAFRSKPSPSSPK